MRNFVFLGGGRRLAWLGGLVFFLWSVLGVVLESFRVRSLFLSFLLSF